MATQPATQRQRKSFCVAFSYTFLQICPNLFKYFMLFQPSTPSSEGAFLFFRVVLGVTPPPQSWPEIPLQWPRPDSIRRRYTRIRVYQKWQAGRRISGKVPECCRLGGESKRWLFAFGTKHELFPYRHHDSPQRPRIVKTGCDRLRQAETGKADTGPQTESGESERSFTFSEQGATPRLRHTRVRV